MSQPTTRRQPFSKERRRALLDEYFSSIDALKRLRVLDNQGTDEVDARRLRQHESLYNERIAALNEEYRTGVPIPSLSRCPFTEQVAYHSLDYFDLDGLWWAYENPIRPDERLPSTFFAVTGAVHLNGAPAWSPLLCKPGPEVPFVVPRMLEHPAVKAVISSVSVGPHQAFPIFYFVDAMPWDLERIDAWGTNTAWFPDETGRLVWHHWLASEDQFDFELEPWLASGDLLWIAPDDATLRLQSGASGCPYVGLPGRREVMRIQFGKVWTLTEPLVKGTPT